MIIKGSSPIKTKHLFLYAEIGKDVPNTLLVKSTRSLPPVWCWLYASRGDKPGLISLEVQWICTHKPAALIESTPKWAFFQPLDTNFHYNDQAADKPQQDREHIYTSTAPSHSLLSFPYGNATAHKNHPFQMAHREHPPQVPSGEMGFPFTVAHSRREGNYPQRGGLEWIFSVKQRGSFSFFDSSFLGIWYTFTLRFPIIDAWNMLNTYLNSTTKLFYF